MGQFSKGECDLAQIETHMLVLLIVCLGLSGIFSGAEAAFLSAQRIRLQKLVNEGSSKAASVVKMVEHPEKLLPTILLGNNLVNTAAAALATAIAIDLVEDDGVGIMAATIAVTVFLLIFGETIPKTISANHSERIAIILVLPTRWLQWILKPVTIILEWIAISAARVLGGVKNAQALVTEEEIKAMVSLGQEAGSVESGEADMIRRVLEFGDLRVREIMTPRPEMVCIELGATFRQFLHIYDQHSHTRFPVFEEDIDKIVGLISVKDVVRSLAKGSMAMANSVTSEMRSAYYVPETKLVHETFDSMRSMGHQMAVVIDEFGGVSGVVTLKALAEKVVGPVGEEGQAPSDEVIVLGEDSFEIDAAMLLEEANQRLSLNLPEGDYDTLAGFLLDRLGHVPDKNERLVVDNLQFEITEIRGVKIERVLVTRLNPAS